MVAHSAGFQHDVVRRPSPDRLSVAEQAVADLGQDPHGFEVAHLYTRGDVEAVTPAALATFDAVLFFTTGILPFTAEARRELFALLRAGRGLVGVHSATDTWYDVPEYVECIGGSFNGHPWHQRVRIVVEDPAHPSTRHLGPAFEMTDEIYQFRDWTRENVHVLLRLDPGSVDITRGARADRDYALAWHRHCGRGRVFHTALGHRAEVWADARFRRHLAEGIRWAMRAESATLPSPGARTASIAVD